MSRYRIGCHIAGVGRPAAGLLPGTDLLLKFDAAPPFIDSASGRAITLVGTTPPARDTTNFKFGPSSVSGQSGADAGVNVGGTAFNLSGQFCIDFWFRFNATSGQSSLAQFGVAFSADYRLFFYSQATAGTLVNIGVAYNSGGGSLSSPQTFNGANFNHVALTRDATTLRLFMNGQLQDSAVTTLSGATSPCSVMGAPPNGQGLTSANIDEFRVVIGNPVWTSNFTPPSSPY